jgi:hypothetical protein
MSWAISWGLEGGEIQDGDDLASNTGWADFVKWCDTLPVEHFHELVFLSEDGLSDRLDELQENLYRALKLTRVPRHVRDVLVRLHGIVASRPKGATALVVTDGTSDADADAQDEAGGAEEGEDDPEAV